MSLTIYRRHRAKCKYESDRSSKKCRCSLWLAGTLFGKPYRKSAKTRSWDGAEKAKRNLEDGKSPEQSITIKAALAAFIKDCERRNLSRNTLRKYRTLESAINAFGEDRGLARCADFNADAVRDFASHRKLSPLTAGKELGHIRAFFSFCIQNDWLTKNPAKLVKAPKTNIIPRLPFSEEEIQNILSQAQDDRELCFLLTLRHTGLRIGDASLLRLSQVSGDRVSLHTTKAGNPVSIKIPPQLESLLKAISPKGGYFFLRGESTHPHTASDLWRKRIKAICKEVGIVPDHPHRFRHSLAVDLLTKGASVEDVAAILGNSPAIVIKHYSQWIASRQTRLDDFLTNTWTKSALVK